MTRIDVSATFAAEDRRAVEAIDRLREDLTRAKSLSPALIAPLKDELKTREASLRKAREAAHEHGLESAELARATARRQAALTQLNTSVEVEPAAAREIVLAAETAKYLESARRRRVDAARDAAASAYGRVCKDIASRNAAVHYAEHVAAGLIERDESRATLPTRADVLAWLPLVLPAEGRAFFEAAHARRKDNPNFPIPPSVAEYDAACKRVYAQIENARAEAARQAAELAGLDFGAAAGA